MGFGRYGLVAADWYVYTYGKIFCVFYLYRINVKFIKMITVFLGLSYLNINFDIKKFLFTKIKNYIEFITFSFKKTDSWPSVEVCK